jgi:SAM-dependent methyltransferase
MSLKVKLNLGNFSIFSPVKIASDLLWSVVTFFSIKYARGRLVDIGCGKKPYKILFEDVIDEYFGVDWQEASSPHYGAETCADLYADCTNTKLPSESFDTLISTQVMEHIYDTDSYLNECYRLLKFGGFGLFTVPFAWENHGEPFDYYRFSKHSLEKLFTEKGFEIVEIAPIGGAYSAFNQIKIVSIYNRPQKLNMQNV